MCFARIGSRMLNLNSACMDLTDESAKDKYRETWVPVR